mgnify:CR=1 FL=1
MPISRSWNKVIVNHRFSLEIQLTPFELNFFESILIII